MCRFKVVVFLLLTCTQILSQQRDIYGGRSQYGSYEERKDQRPTKEIRIKQGRLKGIVIRPTTYHELQFVDVFLGIPYAEPPVGLLRFSPPQSPKSWRGVRQFQEFAPVCPQVRPNLEEVKSARYEHLQRILPYLKNHSEDCLYLNIYTPHQTEGDKQAQKLPVIVFIHGESYQWNSGNPYDGTILAAYGNIIFITINFRLGIIGFLRPGIKDDTSSNFGLLDQIAALVWIRDNIAEFGGDPSTVTILGHGTGAIFANLLLISPVASKQDLFKRAILMSGSALNPDAIAKAPLQITKQVAHALNCRTTPDEELAECLRNREVDELLKVKIHKPKYVPAYATLVDSAVMPEKPIRLMEDEQTFGKYDLLYGVTELEKFHILPLVSLLHGLLDDQRDQILRDHIKATHELEVEMILSKVLEHYGDSSNGYDEDYVKKNRNMVLEVISDSSTVAPLVLAANIHSKMMSNSYMYVFTHAKIMKDFTGDKLQRAVNGEELPYVLGAPLNSNKYSSFGQFDKEEILFSQAIMNWWCNFAETGNPNEPRRLGSMIGNHYLTGGPNDWTKYEVYWTQYDEDDQTYFNLTIPPETGTKYRENDMKFWNEKIPDLFKYPNSEPPAQNTAFTSLRGPRPVILDIADGMGSRAKNMSMNLNAFESISHPGMIIGNTMNQNKSNNLLTDSTFHKDVSKNLTIFTVNSDLSNSMKSTSTMSMVICFGVIFLIINISAFVYVYFKRRRIKSNPDFNTRKLSKEDSKRKTKLDNHPETQTDVFYKSESKPDINDVIKNDKAYDNNSNFGRRSKHSRHNSISTIDTHIKVREWIQQEIVQRCSPRFLRKTRETLQKEHRDRLSKQQLEEDKTNKPKMTNKIIEDSIYEDSPMIVVRPGKSSKAPKVSVAVDATPATRTASILNQIPIEIEKDFRKSNTEKNSDYLTVLPADSNYAQADTQVVIEHHHSKSDPLPMENVSKIMKLNQPKVYESDSESSCSLYAKVTAKNKLKLSTLSRMVEIKDDPENNEQNIYEKISVTPTFITFSGKNNLDVNVTSKEPTAEMERTVSHEEALKTIKRRNYPKVLPDLEKRLSLPVKNSCGILNKQELPGTNLSRFVPLPPPRIFSPAENYTSFNEVDDKDNSGIAIANLHVGPLIVKAEPVIGKDDKKNACQSSADNLTESIFRNSLNTVQEPISRQFHSFIPQTQALNVTKSISSDTLNKNYGNNNWSKNISTFSRSVELEHPKNSITKFDNNSYLNDAGISHFQQAKDNIPFQVEPVKIVITPKIGNFSANESDKTAVKNKIRFPIKSEEHATFETFTNQSLKPANDASQMISSTLPKQRKQIVSQNQADCSGTLIKHPKIIIKPTTMSLQRNRHRNVPKVSAIPSPENQNMPNIRKDNFVINNCSERGVLAFKDNVVDRKLEENTSNVKEVAKVFERLERKDDSNYNDKDPSTMNVQRRRLL